MVSTSFHAGRFDRKDFNLLVFVNLLIAFIGSIFLAWNDVRAGVIYTLLFLGGVVLLFLVFFFLKDDATLRPVTDFVRVPIAQSTLLSGVSYLFGLFVPVLLYLLVRPFTSFDITGLSVPLFGASISGQTFSAVQISSSMPWRLFVIMFTAGTTETFIFNFVAVVVGVLIGLFLLKLLTGGDRGVLFFSRRSFVLTVAFAFSTGVAVLAHLLNSTYSGVSFFVAALFFLLASVSIYLFGLFLAFWIGYHQMNNLLYLVSQDGWSAVLGGFVSWFGLVFLVYLFLIVFFVLRSWKSLGGEWRRYWGG